MDEDQDLVERAKHGEARAFELLLAKYRRRVVRLAARVVGNPAEAEDIAQEVFFRAYQALGEFRGDGPFYHWLCRITLNTARNQLSLRDRQRQSGRFTYELFDLDSPEDLLVRQQLGASMASAFDGLPGEWRTALMLRERDGMSYEEIALVMGCPVGTVRSRIARARGAVARQCGLRGGKQASRQSP